MKIFVSGLLNIETTVAVRGFPIDYYPIDYPFFGIRSAVSGVGYNVAKALATLGDDVNLVSFLGDDAEAQRILAQLARDGIGTDGIRRGLNATPVSAVLFDPQGRRQIYCDLKDMTNEQVESLVIAYEPIWAIGTGKTATKEDANATISVIRKAIAGVFGQATADKVRIQYGGSMNPKNASELMAMPEIDGGLIGGASLKAEDFSKVVHF